MIDPITQFMDDLESHSADHAAIAQQVRSIYQGIDPSISEKFIYGGIGFYLNETHMGGVYGHKEHMNIVFSRGNELSDPGGLLAGKGKYRRHISAATSGDVVSKQVRFFIEQVIDLEK